MYGYIVKPCIVPALVVPVSLLHFALLSLLSTTVHNTESKPQYMYIHFDFKMTFHSHK